jgi:glutathione S-transferase
MPVLRDETRGRTVAEATIIPARRFLPADADAAWQTQMLDRFYDLYVQEPMQKIVTDRLRSKGKSDGAEQAKEQLREAYRMIEELMQLKTWAMGNAFSLADAHQLQRFSTPSRSCPSVRRNLTWQPISTG